METGLQKAIRLVGGGAELGRLLGVTKSAVSQWASVDHGVPLERCVDIERATNGAVTCEELRPDKVEFFQHFRGTSKPTAEAA